MSEFHHRLSALFKKNRVSIAVFSKESNINRASLSAYINGHTTPGLPFFTSLFSSKHFQKIDAYWLFTGEASASDSLTSYVVSNVEGKYNTSNADDMSNMQVVILERLIKQLLDEALHPIIVRLDALEQRVTELEEKLVD